MEGLLPDLAPDRVIRQPFDLLGQAISIEGPEHVDDPAVERPSPLLEETPIGHLVGEGVFKGVDEFGEEARFIEELRGLQMRHGPLEAFVGELGDGLQEGKGDVGADNGGGLEHMLRVGWEPIDPGGEHGLH
jgi:hypothetical protein